MGRLACALANLCGTPAPTATPTATAPTATATAPTPTATAAAPARAPATAVAMLDVRTAKAAIEPGAFVTYVGTALIWASPVPVSVYWAPLMSPLLTRFSDESSGNVTSLPRWLRDPAHPVRIYLVRHSDGAIVGSDTAHEPEMKPLPRLSQLPTVHAAHSGVASLSVRRNGTVLGVDWTTGAEAGLVYYSSPSGLTLFMVAPEYELPSWTWYPTWLKPGVRVYLLRASDLAILATATA